MWSNFLGLCAFFDLKVNHINTNSDPTPVKLNLLIKLNNKKIIKYTLIMYHDVNGKKNQSMNLN